MIETWTPLEVVGGLTIVVAVIAPPLFAWADRWLDRTRNNVTDKVTSGDE